jgi:hypothetical protein
VFDKEQVAFIWQKFGLATRDSFCQVTPHCRGYDHILQTLPEKREVKKPSSCQYGVGIPG